MKQSTKDRLKTDNSGLAYFIVDAQYERWAQDKNDLELKWDKNRRYFNREFIAEDKWKEGEGEGWRSTTSLGVAKQKAVSATALVIDMMIRDGKIPFRFKSSPLMDKLIKKGMFDKAFIEEGISDMNKQVEQQLLDCNADREFAKNIMSMAVYGETYAKFGVITVNKKAYNIVDYGFDASRLPSEMIEFSKEMKTYDSPSWKYVSNWEVYRDLEEEDVQKCEGIIHKRLVSPYELRKMKNLPFAIKKNIDNVLTSHSSKSKETTVSDDETTLPPRLRELTSRSKNIELYEYHGRVPRSMVEEFSENNKDKLSGTFVATDLGDGDEVEMLVMVAGKEVVAIVSREDELRPWAWSPWERALDDYMTIGVIDNVQPEQFIMNGTIRAIEDNTKLSANVQFGVQEHMIKEEFECVKPGNIFHLKEAFKDIRSAIQQIKVDNVTQPLIELMRYADIMADNSSLIPKISQGMNPRTDATATEINTQEQNAGRYIGNVIRNSDEGLIEPGIQWFYDWNMDDPEYIGAKFAMDVQPMGYSSFRDRLVRLNYLQQLLQLAMTSPELGQHVKMRELMTAIMTSLELNDEFLVSLDEVRARQEAQMQQMQVEQQKADMMLELEAREKQAGAERIMADAQGKIAKAQNQAESLQLKREKAGLEAQKDSQQLQLEKVKLAENLADKAIERGNNIDGV